MCLKKIKKILSCLVKAQSRLKLEDFFKGHGKKTWTPTKPVIYWANGPFSTPWSPLILTLCFSQLALPHSLWTLTLSPALWEDQCVLWQRAKSRKRKSLKTVNQENFCLFVFKKRKFANLAKKFGRSYRLSVFIITLCSFSFLNPTFSPRVDHLWHYPPWLSLAFTPMGSCWLSKLSTPKSRAGSPRKEKSKLNNKIQAVASVVTQEQKMFSVAKST